MKLSRLSLFSTGVGLFSLLTCSTLFASTQFHAHQLEGMVGVSHSSLSFSHLGSDTLHSDSANNDVLWGVAYAYNILPWFAAYQHPKESDVLQHVLVGLDWLFLNTTNSGDVYQYGNPDMNNFEYDFDVKTSRIMANAEVDFKSPWKKVFPYVQASVGGARIVTHYHDEPDTSSMGGGVEIDDHTNYNLTYSMGAGIKYLVTPHFQLSASYLFTDFGVIEASEETLSDRFYTNSGLVGFTYLFG